MKSLVRNLSWTALLLNTSALTVPLPKSTDTFDTLFAGLKTAVKVVEDFVSPPGSIISPVQLVFSQFAARAAFIVMKAIDVVQAERHFEHYSFSELRGTLGVSSQILHRIQPGG